MGLAHPGLEFCHGQLVGRFGPRPHPRGRFDHAFENEMGDQKVLCDGWVGGCGGVESRQDDGGYRVVVLDGHVQFFCDLYER